MYNYAETWHTTNTFFVWLFFIYTKNVCNLLNIKKCCLECSNDYGNTKQKLPNHFFVSFVSYTHTVLRWKVNFDSLHRFLFFCYWIAWILNNLTATQKETSRHKYFCRVNCHAVKRSWGFGAECGEKKNYFFFFLLSYFIVEKRTHKNILLWTSHIIECHSRRFDYEVKIQNFFSWSQGIWFIIPPMWLITLVPPYNQLFPNDIFSCMQLVVSLQPAYLSWNRYFSFYLGTR